MVSAAKGPTAHPVPFTLRELELLKEADRQALRSVDDTAWLAAEDVVTGTLQHCSHVGSQSAGELRLSIVTTGMTVSAPAAPATASVLHKVYAKVLDQTRERANSRIEAALREWNEPD